MSDTSLPTITFDLHHVSGGAGRAKAIATGVQAAYTAARPWLAKGASAVETIGNYVGGAVAIKEAWDFVRGNGTSDKQPPQP